MKSSIITTITLIVIIGTTAIFLAKGCNEMKNDLVSINQEEGE